ncbi:hypothetical protein RIF29_48517 [Crotalaria pallida]|uniref:Uncharacterized protein n=1 Tax=Crotalaria pallida TaxID=3830 RepID=A0AAN9DRZ5_CROPI
MGKRAEASFVCHPSGQIRVHHRLCWDCLGLCLAALGLVLRLRLRTRTDRLAGKISMREEVAPDNEQSEESQVLEQEDSHVKESYVPIHHDQFVRKVDEQQSNLEKKSCPLVVLALPSKARASDSQAMRRPSNSFIIVRRSGRRRTGWRVEEKSEFPFSLRKPRASALFKLRAEGIARKSRLGRKSKLLLFRLQIFLSFFRNP